MKDLTKEEFEKLRVEWKAIRKSEKEVDYKKYINTKIHRREIMENRANDLVYRKMNKRKREIRRMVRPQLEELIKAHSEETKVVIINGSLQFIGKERIDKNGDNAK